MVINKDKAEVCDYGISHHSTKFGDGTTDAYVEVFVIDDDTPTTSEHKTWQDTEQELKRLIDMYQEQGVGYVYVYGLSYRLNTDNIGVIYEDFEYDV